MQISRVQRDVSPQHIAISQTRFSLRHDGAPDVPLPGSGSNLLSAAYQSKALSGDHDDVTIHWLGL